MAGQPPQRVLSHIHHQSPRRSCRTTRHDSLRTPSVHSSPPKSTNPYMCNYLHSSISTIHMHHPESGASNAPSTASTAHLWPITTFLPSKGNSRSIYDPCLFFKIHPDGQRLYFCTQQRSDCRVVRHAQKQIRKNTSFNLVKIIHHETFGVYVSWINHLALRPSRPSCQRCGVP